MRDRGHLICTFLLLNVAAKCTPGVKSGKFLQITDFHVNLKYDQKGDPSNGCQLGNRSPKGLLGPFGDRSCDPPAVLMDFMMAEARRQVPNPDFIVWTGDSASHDFHDERDLLATVRISTDSVRANFPGVFVVPVLGNHEYSPANYFPDEGLPRVEIYERIYELWRDWVGEGGKETFLRGGFYRRESPTDGGVFLVLNTNLYYSKNRAAGNFRHQADPCGQLAWLRDELARARDNRSVVHILGHVPPGGVEYFAEPNHWRPEWPMPRRYNQPLARLLADFAPWIGWMLFGHLHTDTFRVVRDQRGSPVQRLFLGPAVTPIFHMNNPAFRSYEYNASSKDIADISTYFVDLDELNRNGANRTRTKLEYSMRSTYGLTAFDADSLDGLVQKFRKNDSAFFEFFKFTKVMLQPGWPNATERATNLCILAHIDMEALERCLAETSLSLRKYWHPLVPLFPLFSIVLLTIL